MVYRQTLKVFVAFLWVSSSNANEFLQNTYDSSSKNNKDDRRFLDEHEHEHEHDDDGDYTDFLENGSVQFEKCSSSTLSENGQYESSMSYWVTFSSTTEDQCGDHCDHPGVVKQTHVIDIRSYLDIMAKYLTNLQEVECNACAMSCETAGVDCGSCMQECEYIENMEANGYLEATEFLNCEMIYDPEDDSRDPLYGGPYCVNDGQRIRIGLFVDEECTIRDENKFAEDYIFDSNGYSIKLSYALLKSLWEDDSSSFQCNAQKDENNNSWMSYLDDEEIESVLEESMEMCYALMKESQNVDHDDHDDHGDDSSEDDVVLEYSDVIQLKKCNTEIIPTMPVAASRSTNIVPTKQFATVDVKFNCNDEESKDTLLMDLDTYLEHVVQYRKIEQSRKCSQCEEFCSRFLGQEEGDDGYEQEKEEHDTSDSCVLCRECFSSTDNEVYEASEFITCSRIQNSQQGVELYAGPVCGEGGLTIQIGVFLDKECTMFDPTKNVEDYLTNTGGNKLDYGLLNSATFTENSCISCDARSQYANEFNYPFDFWVLLWRESQEMCANLFEADESFEFETELQPPSLPPTAAPTPSSSVVIYITPLSLLLSVMVVVTSSTGMSF